MSYRASDQLSAWINEALQAKGAGENVLWEVSPQPHPQGMGLIFIIWAPGAVLGTVISSMAMVMNPLTLTEQGCEGLVDQALEAIHQERSKQLAGSNGGGPPAPGLISP